jgi:histidine triad (HIT) family protein
VAADCNFCKIVAGELPATFVQQDEDVIAIEDVMPQAPVHVLVIPRRHDQKVADLPAAELVQKLFRVAHDVARQKGVDESGYRLVFNVGRDANQTVPHVHLHVLGGRALGWPPG